MVLVNGTKYACQSCIKGHRSSSCRHNERPLFEVQKKGRPVSQCEQCRELRQKKRVHGKCACNGATSAGGTEPSTPGPRHWKYDFDSPDLPSGLKDLACAPSSTPTAAKMRVDGLLNPCECGDTCDCGPRESSTLAAPPLNLGTGLAVLAQAAALMNDGPIPPPKAPPKKAGKRGREGSASPTIRPRQVKRNKQVPAAIATPPTKSSCCSSKAVHSAQVPVLPPLSLFPELAPAGPTPKIMLPPITALELPPLASSLIPAATASGCCCGFQCSCPGCVEHRGQTHADPEHGDCKSSDCATCVDHEGGAGILGPSSTSFSVPAPSATVLDALFARRPSVRP